MLGSGYDDYLEAMENPSVVSVRINTNKVSPAEFATHSFFSPEPVPWCPEGFYIDPDIRPGLHPFWYAGVYYIQEASAMLPGSLVPLSGGETVLDACAAPGGKTTALACRMKDSGLLVSNDISFSRQNATVQNIRRFGISNTCVTGEDVIRLSRLYPGAFDRIVIDVPCSGEGMFRRDPSLIGSWRERGPSDYVPLQRQIAEAALSMLKDGGLLVYSTCTFSLEEDEENILYMQKICPSLTVEKPQISIPGAEKGLLPGTENCIRLYPHKVRGEGHFAALLRKGGQPPQEESFRAHLPHPAKADPAVSAFLSLVSFPFDPARIRTVKEKVMYVPETRLDTSTLRIQQDGLLLGTLKNGRFEPSQHLAMFLKPHQFANILTLSVEEPDTYSFLRGETIRGDVEDGWVLVCAGCFPLGFGKAKNRVIKNKIDPSSRMK